MFDGIRNRITAIGFMYHGTMAIRLKDAMNKGTLDICDAFNPMVKHTRKAIKAHIKLIESGYLNKEDGDDEFIKEFESFVKEAE